MSLIFSFVDFCVTFSFPVAVVKYDRRDSTCVRQLQDSPHFSALDDFNNGISMMIFAAVSQL